MDDVCSPQVGDLVDCGNIGVSKQFGTDIYGTATLNFKYMKRILPTDVAKK